MLRRATCGNGQMESDEACVEGGLCGGFLTAGGMDFIGVCAGSFEMGCTEALAAHGNCEAQEFPAHTVTLTRSFWLGETEVTQDQ